MQLASIPLAKIDVDPRFQVRLQWDPTTDTGLAGLTASLAGLEGLIHPVVVVRLPEATTFGRTYALIAGRRRLEAARRLRWETILARVLPPCDLAAPEHHLHLLAIAVRENTEREDLAPVDRRAALRQLQALYEAVYPEAVQTRHRGKATDAPRPVPFTRWAARITKIPEHTIRRDIRRVLLTTAPLQSDPTVTCSGAATSVAPPSAANTGQDPVAHACSTTHQATTALQTLTSLLTCEARTQLPGTQFTALSQALETLQSTMASVWPAVRIPSEHPLIPFARVVQEQVAALRGTLWGLRSGAPEAWDSLPPTVARQVQSTMDTLLACWQEIVPAVQARSQGVSVAELLPTPPTHHATGQNPVAVA